MKITDNSIQEKRFEELAEGDVFKVSKNNLNMEYMDGIYMKTSEIADEYQETYNCVDLRDGSLDVIGISTLVKPLNCELVIK